MDTVSKDKVLRQIISKLKCIMSDRAAVMKAFDKMLHDYRKDLLGQDDISTQFLFCNAHFLLGLASAAEDGVKVVEERLKGEEGLLGRDRDKSFLKFLNAKDNAASRIVRHSAEVLGPRGDEKNGCREEWLAFCESNNVTSKFTSSRGNRFNNLFENSSAVIFHHNHIVDFLENHASNSNLKLQSILLDLKDNRVLSTVCAMAFADTLLTSPYWSMMNSSMPYGSFPPRVRQMAKKVEKWSTGEYDLMTESSVFTDFSNDTTSHLHFFENSCNKEICQSAFRQIMSMSLIVLKRQLFDFLDGGVFGDELDEQLQQILDTCPLTNLVGERLFGDLDFDISKNRNTSVHHRSTLSMWKHNKTAGWLTKKQSALRSRLLAVAKKNGAALRQKHREADRAVREKIKERLKENNRKRKEREIKAAEQQAKVLTAVLSHGGLCTTKEELDKLFKNGTAEDLRDQIRFRKLVIMKQDDLRLGGNLQMLYQTLLGKMACNPPPAKRVCTVSLKRKSKTVAQTSDDQL